LTQEFHEAPEKALKIDLHVHTSDDPEEEIPHTGRELIDKACLLGFDAISITNHNAVSLDDDLRDYAGEHGILLIAGTELKLQGKHVLVINPPEGITRARTFDDLRRMRTPECLVVAPHPYFPGSSSLLWKTRRHIDLFDAIEFSWFYTKRIDFNVFAAGLAKEHGLALLCTSDCHNIKRFGRNYSLVEAEKNVESIVRAIKAGRLKIETSPLNVIELGFHGARHIIGVTTGKLRKLVAGAT
jgi:predicted metal-dependent phosphoesterase TrpH